MPLCYVIEKFPSPTEYFILNEILELEKNGFEIYLLVLKKQRRYLNMPELNNLKSNIIYLPKVFKYLPFPLLLFSSFSFFRFYRSNYGFRISDFRLHTPVIFLKHLRNYSFSQYFANKIKSKTIPHIHAHFAFIAVDIAYFLSKLLQVKYSFTTHAQDIYINQHKIRQHLSSAEFLITCTEYNKKYINNLTDNIYKDKIYKVYHGTKIEKWPQKTISVNKKNEVQILTVARLEEKKGLIYLLKAIDRLINNGIKVYCTIIGQGTLQSSLKDYIYSKKLYNFIQIKPFVLQNRLKDYYSHADVFVLPCIISANGDRDGLPNVIIEAMLSGIPVISTSVSAIPEVIKHKETGILVKEKDVQDIVDGIEVLISDEKIRQRVIENAKKDIEKKFDIESSTKELIEIFSRYIPNSQP